MTNCRIQLQECQDNLRNWKYALDRTAIISEADSQGRLTDVNDKFLQISGYDREELLGQTPRSLDAGFHSSEFFAQMWATLSQGQVWQGEIKNQRKDGSFYWLGTTITPIVNPSGIPVKYIAIQFDITHRKQTEEELTRSERRFQELATNVPGMIYQFLLRPDGSACFPYMSPVCAQVFGIEPEALKQDAQLLMVMIHPDDSAQFQRSVAVSAETLQPWQWEGRFILPRGEVNWFQGSSRPEKQANGDILWDGLLIDITQRKTAEEALKKSEQKLAFHFQQTPLGVIEWNLNFEAIAWNPAAERIFGYTTDEALGCHATDLIVPESAKAHVNAIWSDLLQTTGGTRSSNENVMKDGRRIICEWYNTPLIDPEGNAIGVASLVQDITERQRSQDALKIANEQLEIRVEQRTTQLRKVVERLQSEIACRQLAEDAVRQAEQKYRTIFENAIMGIFQTTPEGKYISANPALADIYGYESTEELIEELSNIEQQLYVEPNRRTQFMAAMEKHDIVSEFESQVYRKDGSIIWIAENARAVRDVTGKTIYYEGTVEDITKRKHAEAALRRSEARLQEKALREALLNQLTAQIRQSLDLDSILETTVQQIRELLQIELCYFSWYRPYGVRNESTDRLLASQSQLSGAIAEEPKTICSVDLPKTSPCWETVKEARDPTIASILGIAAEVKPLSNKYLKLETIRIDDVRTFADPSFRKIFSDRGFQSLLSLPLKTRSGVVGVLSCANCSAVRPWNESEVALMRSAIERLAIAIDQAELYAQTRAAATQAQQQTQQLQQTLYQLKQTQAQLIQTEKMSSLGQMVAGIAHEINNPVTFIHGNLIHASNYFEELLPLLILYQKHNPEPVPEIQQLIEAIDLEFIIEDLPRVLSSMKMGSERIRQIVLSLRNFSRLDEAQMKPVNLHEGIKNTRLILQHRLENIEVIEEFGNLPLVECYAGQLNQVFMNILGNAIDALQQKSKVLESRNKNPVEKSEETTNSSNSWILNPRSSPTISIRTEVVNNNWVAIRISDNGPGMTEEVKNRLFDPFFTTKPVGKGTGLGLSISYHIVVEKHHGILQCFSERGSGAEFLIQIPLKPPQ